MENRTKRRAVWAKKGFLAHFDRRQYSLWCISLSAGNKNDVFSRFPQQRGSIVAHSGVTYFHKGIKKIFAEIINEKLSGNQRKADIYFELLLCELAENGRYCEGVGIATKLKNIIHSNPEKFFSNKELAEMTNVSVKTAETKFKSVQGKTIHQYMLEFKIKEAISYFDIFPEISIKKIAYNLGFYDEYHFSKQFKKIIGISPSNYKKQQP